MVKCLNCLSFNCISTKANLIFIFIFNTISIAINSYKIHRDNYKKKFLKLSQSFLKSKYFLIQLVRSLVF